MVAPVGAVEVRAADLGDPREVGRIDAFVADHPEGYVFHRPQWSRAVERGCRQRAHYLIAEQGGVLVGCLPLTEMRSPLFGNALVSAAFATGGGLLVSTAAAAARLGEAGWKLADRLGCPALELRGGPVPEGWARQEGVYSNFDRMLPDTADALLASIPKRQRSEVRRSLNSGLETSTGRDAKHRDAHFRVYAECVRNLGTPVFPRALFEAMLDEFGEAADILAVWKDGRPLACFLNFYFKQSFMPFWGGGTGEARRHHANDFIYFDSMRQALQRGFTRADFGRSKVGTGAWERKRIWGFADTPLIYGVRTVEGTTPREVNPLNPKYRLKVAAWQRMPLWAANRLGPVIARGLG